MKTTLRVISVLIAFTIVACVLYPLIAMLVYNVFSWDYEPDRVFRRVWMFSVLAGLLIFRKTLGLQHPARAGFTLHSRSLGNLLTGFLVSCAFLFTLTLLYLAIDQWHYHPEMDEFFTYLFRGMVQGLLVAFIEE